MTYDDFKAKHKENVLKGFDGIDGRDYWVEFKADLHMLLADERKILELQVKDLTEKGKVIYADALEVAKELGETKLQIDELKKEEQDTRNQYTAFKHSAGDRVAELELQVSELQNACKTLDKKRSDLEAEKAAGELQSDEYRTCLEDLLNDLARLRLSVPAAAAACIEMAGLIRSKTEKRVDLGCICKDGNGFAENGCPCPDHRDL